MIILVIVAFVIGYFFYLNRSQSQNELAKYKDLIRTGSAIGLDVRNASELQSSPAPGAMHIPLKVLMSKGLKTEKTVLVFCASGGRSSVAKGYLKSIGIKNVINIGTWKVWNALNE